MYSNIINSLNEMPYMEQVQKFQQFKLYNKPDTSSENTDTDALRNMVLILAYLLF